MIKKLKGTFLGGLQLMIPLFLAAFVVLKLYDLITDFLKPIIEFLPDSPFVGKEFPDLRAFIVFLISVFFCGIILKTFVGQFLLGLINSFVMKIIPGHSVFENMIAEEAESTDMKYKSVIFAEMGETWALGVVIEEENEDGYLMIYIPAAPIPSGGNLYMMKEEKIKRVDISVHDAMKCIWHLGKGSNKLLAGKVKW
ncbi:MAG: DUF502 domain-containing protein [Ignavibacteria bacterium]|nr:DUF502 domain-containing protein [Ignavibacteria bacterium]